MEIIAGHISIQSILESNRFSFKSKFSNQIRESSIQNVEKVLKCRTSELGLVTHKCNDCGEVKHIYFSCKSRFCNSCGKRASDLWMNNLTEWRPRGLHYYHLAFTIPEEFRGFFKRHRKTLQLLPKVAYDSIEYCFRKHKCKPGVLGVIHTFGAQLNRNPHVHCIVSCGGMTEQGYYKQIHDFIPYLLILSSWKSGLLKAIRKRCFNNLSGDNLNKEIKLIGMLYQQKDDSNEKDKSRYIYFSKRAESFQRVSSYIGRYLKRPVISQSRILDHQQGKVMYSYKDKYDNITKNNIVSTERFIGLLIQHIPGKGFPMIYYYGIFANRCKGKYLPIIEEHFHYEENKKVHPKLLVDRIYNLTRIDILACSCGGRFCRRQRIIPGYKPYYYEDP